MTFQITSPFGVEGAEALEPWATEDMERWLDAVGVMFDPTLTISREVGSDGEPGYLPGYGILFDIDECPAGWLGFLGSFVGVPVPVGAPEVEARALVRAESGRERGTPQAVESAISRNLSGEKRFTLLERRNAEGLEDAWWFVVVVSPEELISEAALKAAVNAVKPGGVMWTLVVTEGYEWVAATHTWAEDTMTWAEAAHVAP